MGSTLQPPLTHHPLLVFHTALHTDYLGNTNSIRGETLQLPIYTDEQFIWPTYLVRLHLCFMRSINWWHFRKGTFRLKTFPFPTSFPHTQRVADEAVSCIRVCMILHKVLASLTDV